MRIQQVGRLILTFALVGGVVTPTWGVSTPDQYPKEEHRFLRLQKAKEIDAATETVDLTSNAGPLIEEDKEKQPDSVSARLNGNRKIFGWEFSPRHVAWSLAITGVFVFFGCVLYICPPLLCDTNTWRWKKRRTTPRPTTVPTIRPWHGRRLPWIGFEDAID